MKKYRKIAYNGFKLKIYKEYVDENLLQKCCRNDLGKDPDFQPFSSSSYSRVFKFNYNGQEYFHKVFLNRNMFEPIKAMFRGSRAERSLQGSQLLLRHGFNVPGFILTGSKGNLNFSLTEAPPNARNLTQFVSEKFVPDLNREQIALKKRLIKKLGSVIGQLHSQGIFHGDLRWGNILVQESPLAIWFVDNERTSIHGRYLSCKKRLKNLVQINMTLDPVITRTDRIAFLISYLRENRELLPRKNELAAQVQERTELRLAKHKAYNIN
ncbi:MAG: lipopolysaccharide kinase InaA family protein [Desulfurivibrionaceae bacterium]